MNLVVCILLFPGSYLFNFKFSGTNLMASTSIQNVSHWTYNAFLSFRGEDTRKSFTSHLYAALNGKGIYVFKDDKELERGQPISPGLLKAIEDSRISVIVFSQNFASSTWCLDELVKIVECKNKSDQQQMVFPIYYDVEPTVVRKQTGSFREAFSRHEEVFKENMEKVQKWREALKEVANISGWELKEYRNESEFIWDIVKEISGKIPVKSETLKKLVGIDSRLEKLRVLMDEGPNDDVRMIGICGMGGLGKTTLARVVYDLISLEFEGNSFLADVREKSEKDGSVISFQRQLLSQLLKLEDNIIWNIDDGINILGSRLQHRKVLLVIDDVVDIKQLEYLAGKHEWFGSGSRIIITSRDEHLLKTHGMDEVYKPNGLNYNEALQLFNMKAFKTHQPLEECVLLSERVIKYANGLPLALEVLGSFLNGRSVDQWESTLERLQVDPPNQIMSVLEISFNGLQDLEKKIFLDVACFFKGKDRDYVTKILEGCGFSPIIGMEVLIEKSLITIDKNRLWMHDLLQELGQQIIQRQSPEEPGRRSRLWKEEEVRQLLTENTGSEVVEGIMTDLEVCISVSAKAFSKMTNLRLLKISNVLLPEGLEYLPKNLRLLDWNGYPLQLLPSNLQLDKTIEFKMYYSRIEEIWKGFKSFKMLKVMKLSHSLSLIKIPDFSGVPNLEELDLEGCSRLREIHPSLLLHNKLITLYLNNCTSLTTLPGKIFMKSLAKLFLRGCSKLKKFPEIIGSMECLSKLYLGRTAIEELPVSIERLSKLVLLDLKSCKNLKSLPRTISGLKCLSKLNLSGSSKFREFPDIAGRMENLRELLLGGTTIRELPVSIELLSGLVYLNLKDCRSLESLPIPISNLKSLRTLVLSGCWKLKNFPEIVRSMEDLSALFLDGTSITEVPSSIELLTGLKLLNLKDCKNLLRLPSSISGLKSLKTLNLCGCFKLENVPSSIFLLRKLVRLSLRGCKGSPSFTSWSQHFPFNLIGRTSDPVALSLPPSLSGLCSLMELDLSECNIGEGAIPSDIGKLYELEKLCLSKNSFVSLPVSINRLFKLKDLDLEECKRLQFLPRLPASIRNIIVDGCASLETLSDVLKLNKLQRFEIRCIDCLKLFGNNDLALSLLKEYIERICHMEANIVASLFLEVKSQSGSSIRIKRVLQ